MNTAVTTPAANPTKLKFRVRGRHPVMQLHNRPETISNFLRMQGVWQLQVTAFITSYLADGDTFVDVGANIGYFSIYAALKVGPSGMVHAIEPDDENAKLLHANLHLNGLANVAVHRLAVSNIIGEGTLYRSDFNGGGHSLLPKDDLMPGASVPIAKLDDLLEGAPPPKLIKIDVQGTEMEVLHGAQRVITNCHPRPAIILECSPIDLSRNGHIDELFDFIDPSIYSLRAFIANDRGKAMPPQIRKSTLRQITDDLLAANDAAEFDLLLLPKGKM